MPTPQTLIAFAGVALLFAASPGPNFIYVLSRSVGQGRRDGLASVAGIVSGAAVHTGAAVLGISALLMASEVAFDVVRVAGAVYLVVLGVRTLRQPDSAGNDPAMRDLSRSRSYRDGLVTMVLNPKAALYYVAVLPQFVDAAAGSPAVQLAVFGAMQALAALVVYTGVAVAAGPVGDRVRHSLRWRRGQRWATGITYLGLGAALALSGRRTS